MANTFVFILLHYIVQHISKQRRLLLVVIAHPNIDFRVWMSYFIMNFMLVPLLIQVLNCVNV